MEMLIIGLIALAAFAAVLVPLFRRRPGIGDEREFENVPPADASDVTDVAPHATPPSPAPGDQAPAANADEIELEVRRYRTAVRAGTVCSKCGQANPADSAFCFECGARLPLADAKEFE